MKSILILTIATIFMSCGAKKEITSNESQQDTTFLKSEIYFNNCENALAFLKLVIENNDSDESLKDGQFRIPHIVAKFDHAKSLFPEKCFIGMPEKELMDIFGKWDYAGTSANHPAWYILQNKNEQLSIEVWIRDGTVEKFKVAPISIESSNP